MPVPLLSEDEVRDLAGREGLLAVSVVPGAGLGLARDGTCWAASGGPHLLDGAHARLVWWRARTTAPALVEAGVRPRAGWDLGAVHRLLHGSGREDPAAVWAGASGHEEPADVADATPEPEPVRPDGRLSPGWSREPWTRDEPDGRWLQAALTDGEPADPAQQLQRAATWAALALQVQARQAQAVAALPDPRPRASAPPLAVLTAYAESAAALLAVELEHDGLPVDRAEAARLLTEVVGPRPRDGDAELRARQERDGAVLRHFPGSAADLRNPAAVRELLARVGVDVPDTRSWRLEPHRRTSPGVAALLDWRRAERIATTYGWPWLDRSVGDDGRLRGQWSSADAAAGRMTASAGLHNLPALLRPVVAAEPGHVLVRADLGQVEPRVLAVVSGDEGLAAAAREQDMYAPVAAALGADRPTAKVAVLAAMYGQTTGTAGAALRRMEVAYPKALAHLRAAEQAGLRGQDLRTWGGRLLRLAPPAEQAAAGYGRYARNAVVQGAAAELFKVWAATVRAGLPELGGSVVLCLHDELLLHVPVASADRARALLLTALQHAAARWAAGSPVRFVADVDVVRRWSDAKG